MPVVQIMYCSEFQFPLEEMERHIDAILAKAIASNKDTGITGCLAHGRGWFLQALEGSPAAVTELMSRIEADCRHSDIKLLLRREIGARSFPDWSMASIDLVHGNPGFLARGLTGGEFSPLKTPPLNLLMTLMDAADRKRMAS